MSRKYGLIRKYPAVHRLTDVDAHQVDDHAPATRRCGAPGGYRQLAGIPRPSQALNACFDFDRTTCEKYAVAFAIVVEAGLSFAEWLFGFCTKCLPTHTEAEILRIVGLRLTINQYCLSWVDEVLEMDDAYENIDRMDIDKVKAEQASMRCKVSKNEQFTSEYQTLHAKKREGVRLPKAPKHYKLPSTIPQVDAKKHIPPTCAIWRGLRRFEWCGHCRPFKRVSASWLQHGESGSLKFIYRKLWTQYLSLTGQDMSACPLANLWDDA
jgi:hypothetical protein